MTKTKTPLECIYSPQKSFNGKATISVEEGVERLYSYNTKVAEKSDDVITLMTDWNASQTTVRHVVEFLNQNGAEVDGKKDVERLIEKGILAIAN